MDPYLPSGSRGAVVDVAINGRRHRRLTFPSAGFPPAYIFSLAVEDIPESKIVDIIFIPVTPKRPVNCEDSGDSRLLGICLRLMRLEAVKA